MPKLYEYLGLIILFYSNEHEPIHVHGQRQGREAKAELVLENGQVIRIDFSNVRGRKPLKKTEMRNFRALNKRYAKEIVGKWVDYFVLHKPIVAQKITERIR